MSLHQANLRERALTDRDAASELAEADRRFGPTDAEIAAARKRNAQYNRAMDRVWGAPAATAVPIPIDGEESRLFGVIERWWSDPEYRAEVAEDTQRNRDVANAAIDAGMADLVAKQEARWAAEGRIALTDVRRDRDGRIGG